MSEPQKKPGVMFWVNVVLIVALAYLLSFGPVCWVVESTEGPIRPLVAFYRPLMRAAQYPGWEWPGNVIGWYGGDMGFVVYLVAALAD